MALTEYTSTTPTGPRPMHTLRTSEKTRVLVVEDEHDIAGLIKHTLERSGDAAVEVAPSGDQALKLASEQPPDLIILDLNLPVLGGLEVCRLLRTRPGTAKTPIKPGNRRRQGLGQNEHTGKGAGLSQALFLSGFSQQG